jgi:aspartate 1-decarboxylase
VIVAAYATVDDREVERHVPKIVLVDAANRIKVVKSHEGAGIKVGAV